MDTFCKTLKRFMEFPGETMVEWLLRGPLVLGLLIGAIFTILAMNEKINQLSKERENKEISEAMQGLNALMESNNNYSQNIMELMFENLRELREFYVISKVQIRRSFSAALISCFAGFVLFITSIILFILKENSQASFMAELSGIIVEIISGLFFWLYKAASKQLENYYKRLEKTEEYLIALQVINLLPRKKQPKEYKKVIKCMLAEKV